MTLPHEIEHALSNIGAAMSPITVQWKMKMVPHEGKTLGPDSLWAKWGVTVRGEKFYQHRESNDGRRIESHVLEYSCDGKYSFFANHGQCDRIPAQRQVTKSPLDSKDQQNRQHPVEYLYWAGISVPYSNWWTIGRLAPSSLLLAMLEAGGHISAIETVELDGSPVVNITVHAPNPEYEQAKNVTQDDVSRELAKFGLDQAEVSRALAHLERRKSSPPLKRYAFYLDPAHGYAAARCEEFDDKDKLEFRANNSDWSPLQRNPNVWLPRKIILGRYSWPGYYEHQDTPRSTESIDLILLSEEDVPDDLFDLTVKYNKPHTQLVNFGETQLYITPDTPAT
jgi:hypothetical protein